MFLDKKCPLFFWIWPSISQNQWNINVNALIWQMRKRVQGGDTWKQTNLKIWMLLSQKILLDNIWFAYGFPSSMFTQKVRQPYLFQLFKFASFAQSWAKLKIQDFKITHLQRDEGKIRSWKQKWFPAQYAATSCRPAQLLLDQGLSKHQEVSFTPMTKLKKMILVFWDILVAIKR